MAEVKEMEQEAKRSFFGGLLLGLVKVPGKIVLGLSKILGLPYLLVAAALIGGISFGLAFYLDATRAKAPPTIDTMVVLERIENASHLSTVTTHYTGVTNVIDPQNPQETLYYVSYEAKINAGIDFSQVQMVGDDTNLTLTVTLPEIEITGVDVNIASLDYLFMDDDAHTSTVSAEAYQACVDDANMESEGLGAVQELALENARKMVEALTLPFLTTEQGTYQLIIQ